MSLLVLLLCCGHFLVFFDRFLLSVSAPLISARFGLSDTVMGLLLGPAFAFIYIVVALTLGRYSDGRFRFILLIGGILMWTAGSIGLGLSGSAEALGLSRLALGAGQAAFTPAALALLVGIASPAQRGKVLAMFTTGSSLGRGAAFFGGGALLVWLGSVVLPFQLDDWRALFLITALPNLILIILIATIVPRSAAAPRRSARLLPSWVADHARLALCYAVLSVAPILAIQTCAAWLPTLLVRKFALGAGEAGVAIGMVTMLTAPTGQIIGGLITDRFRACRDRPYRTLVVALALVLPCLVAVVLSARLDATLIALAGLNLALGVSSFAGIYGIQSLSPAGERGAINALFLAWITLIAAGLGPLAAGLLSDLQPDGGAAGIGNALIITIIFCIVIAGCAVRPVSRLYSSTAAAAAREPSP
ncbi:MAG: MFS transporter [Sphingomonadales bacterium]|nr:MFS transporter [Sphingomonadales bacterium]